MISKNNGSYYTMYYKVGNIQVCNNNTNNTFNTSNTARNTGNTGYDRGTATTFSYAIKPGGDGGMFQVNSGTGVIKSNANLNRHVRERMYGYVEKNYYCMYDLDECRINWLSPLSYKYKCRNYGIGGSSDR